MRGGYRAWLSLESVTRIEKVAYDFDGGEIMTTCTEVVNFNSR